MVKEDIMIFTYNKYLNLCWTIPLISAIVCSIVIIIVVIASIPLLRNVRAAAINYLRLVGGACIVIFLSVYLFLNIALINRYGKKIMNSDSSSMSTFIGKVADVQPIKHFPNYKGRYDLFNDGGIIVRFEESDKSFVVFASANNYIQKGLIFSVTYVKNCNIIVEIQQI